MANNRARRAPSKSTKASHRSGASPPPVSAYPVERMLALVRHRYRHALQRESSRHGLTAAQVSLVLALGESDVESAGALAARTHMDQPMLTRLVDRLERDGLVQRERDPGDRRRVTLRLSKRGKALVPSLQPIATRVEQRLVRGLGADGEAALRALLARLYENLEDRE